MKYSIGSMMCVMACHPVHDAKTPSCSAGSASPEVAQIPAGRYSVGCTEPTCADNPSRTVKTGAYRIQTLEVTVSQYRRCIDAGKCSPDSEQLTGENDPSASAIVTFDGAKRYCAWIGAHLPTGEQWEIAARGREGKTWPWGSRFDPNLAPKRAFFRMSDDVAFYYPRACTNPAGASSFGVQDIGNTAEFVIGSGPKTEVRGYHSIVTGKPGPAEPSQRIFVEDNDMTAFRCVW